jgi:hypothetical protein
MLEISIDFASECNEIILVNIDVVWIVFVSFINHLQMSFVQNLVEFFPSFSLGMNEGASKRIVLWIVLFAIIFKELMR